MNYQRILICIAIMAIFTYCARMLPLVFCKKQIENVFFESFLAYLPYGVIAAMTFPDVFFSTGTLVSAIVGVCVGFILSYYNKGFLVVSLAAVAAAYITDEILKFIVSGHI